MSNWSCIEPFGIDNGELDGLSPQECFTLGVEWEMIRQKILSLESFTHMLHAENRERVEALLNRHNCQHYMTFMAGDISESWLQLDVTRNQEG